MRDSCNVGRIKDSWKREAYSEAKVLGRHRNTEREEQGGHPPQQFQSNGTLAAHHLCLFGEELEVIVCHFHAYHGFGTCKKLILFQCFISMFNIFFILFIAWKMTHTIV